MRKVSVNKRIFLCVFSFCLILSSSVNSFSSQEEEGRSKVKTVVFFYDEDFKVFEQASEFIRAEIEKLAEGKYSVRFIEKDSAMSDRNKVAGQIDELIADPNVDLIIGLGFVTGDVVINKKELLKPVILADIYDIDIFGLPYDNGTSGVKNLTYLATKYKMANNINTFRKMFPFKRLHVLLKDVYLQAAEKISSGIDDLPAEIVLTGYKDTVQDTIDFLVEDDVEAVYVGATNFLDESYTVELIEKLNELKLPTFTHTGLIDVERGVLAGFVPKYYTKLVRRVAINADRILRGEEAGNIPVLFEVEERLVVNSRTAKKIGISLPYELLFDAKILYPFEGWGEELTMEKAVTQALNNNLLFRIKDEEIEEAKKEHLLKWSNYLPQIRYSIENEIYDTETANLSFGMTPKWYMKSRFALNQLIFSDPVITSILNSKEQIDIERLDRKTRELDITDDTTRAYLDYLIAKALLKVNMDNFEATKHHLTMAEKRNKIGVGGREEILRWESELAESQSQVIKADSKIRIARINLNQLMNHPQEIPFQEQDVGMEITSYYIGSGQFNACIKNEEMLKIFLAFMVERAFDNSPELKALDAGIKQQKSIKNTAMRRFYLPEADLTGNLDHKLGKKYYGVIPENDHDDWFVGISLSYPIFEGGAKGFDYDKQKASLERLYFKSELAYQFTELDVRRAAYDMYFSLPNIDLMHSAMKSAAGSYRIMEDKYANGTASITDLIDAQNDKFTRESQALISIYEFLQDLTSFDRAVSMFQFYASEEEKKQLMKDLQQYFADRGFDIAI